MSKRTVSGITLTLLFIGMLTLVFNVQPVRASGTVYIRADGSVDPDTAPISNVDNVTYTFTDNINDSIAVERDNIVVDGAGYTVQGTGVYLSKGIDLTGRSNVTIKRMRVKSFWYGIWLNMSSSNNISGNNITANNGSYSIYLEHSSNNSIIENNIANNDEDGICLKSSSNNTIFGNTISNNFGGIELKDSNTNTLTGNTISNDTWAIFLVNSGNNILTSNTVSNNTYGINIGGSDNNRIFHNNFINNTDQVRFQTPMSYGNTWDNSYPSGGSYWTDYTGVDLDHDGIGDTAYDVYAGNQDHYPLMGMFYDFEVTVEHDEVYHVHAISNSTVQNLEVAWWLSSPNEYLQPGQRFIHFFVAGKENATGFCRVTIPRTVLNGTYIVLVDWAEVTANEPAASNTTHAYLYFTYKDSEHEVIIVPEFPSLLILPLFMIATLLAAIVYSKKTNKLQKLRQPHGS